MNIRNKVCSALLSIPLLTISPIALSNDFYNVQEFEVYGVTLADDAEQVIKALSELYSISRDDLKIHRERIAYSDNSIARIRYGADDFRISAYFEPINDEINNSYLFEEPITDVENNSYLLNFEVYFKPVFEDSEELEEFAETFIEKYGTPTLVSTYQGLPRYTWCEKLNARKTLCASGTPRLDIHKKRLALD